MVAKKLQTVDDLLAYPDERVELINGEIVKRPMTRMEHGLAQTGLVEETSPLKRKDGPGGWWIVTEASVRYNEHQCPSHDVAGWRKERVPTRPSGVAEITPDWVCEITSPGHERKDLFHNLLLLQNHQVPFYWIVAPEDRTLIAYGLVNGKYAVLQTVEGSNGEALGKMRVPPFEELPIDLDYVLGKG